MGADALEDEARRRAMGVAEDVYDGKGNVVGTRMRYSDLLLMFLLKGLKPEKYRENYAPTGDGDEALIARIRAQLAAMRRLAPGGDIGAMLPDQALALIAATGDVQRVIGTALIANDTDPLRMEPHHD